MEVHKVLGTIRNTTYVHGTWNGESGIYSLVGTTYTWYSSYTKWVYTEAHQTILLFPGVTRA